MDILTKEEHVSIGIMRDEKTRAETWVKNRSTYCPFCGCSPVWTSIKGTPKTPFGHYYKLYNNSPHFCPNCKVRFYSYLVETGGTDEEKGENQERAEFLKKDQILTVHLLRL